MLALDNMTTSANSRAKTILQGQGRTTAGALVDAYAMTFESSQGAGSLMTLNVDTATIQAGVTNVYGALQPVADATGELGTYTKRWYLFNCHYR